MILAMKLNNACFVLLVDIALQLVLLLHQNVLLESTLMLVAHCVHSVKLAPIVLT